MEPSGATKQGILWSKLDTRSARTSIRGDRRNRPGSGYPLPAPHVGRYSIAALREPSAAIEPSPHSRAMTVCTIKQGLYEDSLGSR
jgi:hypothetical protein